MWYDLLTNKVLLISASAWVIAQMLKVFVVLVREKRVDWRYFVSSGGMPSSHSAVVSALATAVGMTQGLGSVAFAIATILSLVVMYDAAGVRQSVDKQSAILNQIMEELRMKRPIGELEHTLREFIGHTPFQVFIGAFIGILIAWGWLMLSGV